MMRVVLVLLLVATNAFWLIRRLAEPAAAIHDPPLELATLKTREAELRAELETLLPRAPSQPTPVPSTQPVRPAVSSRQEEDWYELLRKTPEAQRAKLRCDLIRRGFDEGATEQALHQIGNSYAPGDDALFRGDVVRCLDSESARVRQAALYALRRLPASEVETARLLELSRDAGERVRIYAGAVLVAHLQGPREGEVSAALVRLLREPDSVSREMVSYGLWDQCPRYTAELEDALLATEGALRSEVFVRAFRYMNPKSDRVVEALLKGLSGYDAHHFADALDEGVPPRLHARVADVALNLLRTRRQTMRFPFDLLARYGSGDDAATLERMLAQGQIDRGLGTSVERAAAAIRERVAPGR